MSERTEWATAVRSLNIPPSFRQNPPRPEPSRQNSRGAGRV